MTATSLQSCIRLQNLELEAFLGWPDAERAIAQSIAIDVTLHFSTLPAGCVTDELSDTTCYATLVEQIRATVTAKPYRLIEHIGHAIYQTVKQAAAHAAVHIDVQKLPPIPNLEGGVRFSIGD